MLIRNNSSRTSGNNYKLTLKQSGSSDWLYINPQQTINVYFDGTDWQSTDGWGSTASLGVNSGVDVVIGKASVAPGASNNLAGWNVAIGYQASADAGGVSLGSYAVSGSNTASSFGTAIGSGSAAGASTNFGDKAAKVHTGTDTYGAVALGNDSYAGATNAQAIGKSSKAISNYACAFGVGAYASGLYSLSVGTGTDTIATAASSTKSSTASGNYSMAFGMDSFASTESSMALGRSAKAYSTAYGVSVESFTSAAASSGSGIAIGGGSALTATTAQGSKGATATGASAIAIGRDSLASNNYSVALGYQNKATGSSSFALGGHYTYIKRGSTVGFSDDGSSKRYWNRSHYFVNTSDNTPTELVLGGTASARFVLEASSSVRFTANIVARDNVANESASYKIDGLIQRDAANNTVLKWSNITVEYEDDASWDITVAADDVHEAVVFTVTGDATNPTQFDCMMDTIETRF